MAPALGFGAGDEIRTRDNLLGSKAIVGNLYLPAPPQTPNKQVLPGSVHQTKGLYLSPQPAWENTWSGKYRRWLIRLEQDRNLYQGLFTFPLMLVCINRLAPSLACPSGSRAT